MKSYSHVDNKGIPLDEKLDKLFHKKENGFYIELGANDGIAQSNTAFFEKCRGWKGVLIEPSFSAFEACQKNRPNSNCFNAACVSQDYKEEYVSGDFNGHLMSSVDGKRLNKSSEIVKVKATTLEKILDEVKAEKIDFLSLDTEGYELPILKGLNLNKYRPTYLLIEIYNKDYNDLVNYLSENNYKLLENFSNYNHTDNPYWDGTHNDYLFIDTLEDQLTVNDICSGEKFQQLCDIYCGTQEDLQRNPVIRLETHKHLNLVKLTEPYNNPSLVFCYSCSLELFMSKINLFQNNFVLVSHNEDENITEKYRSLADNPKIIRWFAQNLMINHDKVEILPIGLANAMWPHGNLQRLVDVYNKTKNKEKLNEIFFNFTCFSNNTRHHCKSEVEKKGLKFLDYIQPHQYLEIMAKYKFAICPDGHGIDCHRIWEAYYLNLIPIMLKSTFSLHVQNYLPCVLLEKWEDLDVQKCLENYDKYLDQLKKSRKYLFFDTYKSRIVNAAAKMNIAYTFIGSLPHYALDTVHQLRLFYNGPIYFILNDYENPIIDVLKNKYNVEIIRYDTVYHQEFNDIVTKTYNRFCIVDSLKGREKIFIYSFERFFVLYNLMKQRNMSNIFFLEIDNLIYDNPINWLKEFSKKEMAYMYDNHERFASGVCFIKSHIFLQNFLDHCIDFILHTNMFVSEMGALYTFYQKNKENIQMLPIHWSDTSIPIEAYESFELYNNSIFDSAGIGVYIGGADPKHTGGVIKKGHKNQWSFIDYTKYQYRWEKDEKERNIPYIWNGNEWLQLNNLHIHSKDLSTYISL
jgi:FkbM family methyltransferase